MCAMQVAKSPRSHSRSIARGAQVASRKGLSWALLAVMTVSAGVGIANLYYNQPLLDQMGRSLGASAADVGMAPTLTQIGYSIGMLFLVPLGDMLQRRRIVLLFTLLTALLSIGLAASMSTAMLLGMRFLLGHANITQQLLVLPASQGRPSSRLLWKRRLRSTC
jgi:predicted MFS family arabinose efflux permease